MAFIMSILLPILGYLIVNAGAETGAKLLPKTKKPVNVEARYEDLIYQSMRSIVSLDELVTALSVQVAHLTTSLSEIKVDVKKIGEENIQLSTALKKVNERITKESTDVTIALKKVNERITKESVEVTKLSKTGIADLQSSLKETKIEVGKIKTEIAETDEDLGNVKIEIQNLKTSCVEIKGKVDNMSKEVAVVSAEQGGGNQKCVKVCAGTTGRTKSGWVNYPGSGVYMDVDISRCGYVSVPTITSSIEGSSSHWTATGTASIYSSEPTKFRIYLSQGGLRTGRAKQYKWNVEWIAVGYTC